MDSLQALPEVFLFLLSCSVCMFWSKHNTKQNFNCLKIFYTLQRNNMLRNKNCDNYFLQ